MRYLGILLALALSAEFAAGQAPYPRGVAYSEPYFDDGDDEYPAVRYGREPMARPPGGGWTYDPRSDTWSRPMYPLPEGRGTVGMSYTPPRNVPTRYAAPPARYPTPTPYGGCTGGGYAPAGYGAPPGYGTPAAYGGYAPAYAAPAGYAYPPGYGAPPVAYGGYPAGYGGDVRSASLSVRPGLVGRVLGAPDVRYSSYEGPPGYYGGGGYAAPRGVVTRGGSDPFCPE